MNQSYSTPPRSNTGAQSLVGAVERVVMHNTENGFCVLRVIPQGSKGIETVVGIAASVTAGEVVHASGRWEQSRFGKQFKSDHLRFSQPATGDGIQKFLASIHGIGPVHAKKLVDRWNTRIFEIIEVYPHHLEAIGGIGKVRRKQIVAAYAENKALREVMVFLHAHGIGTALATKIHQRYKDKALEVVSKEPYRLVTDLYGVGFKTADELAQNLGVASDSEMRLEASLVHVLDVFAERGHVCAERPKLLQAATRLTGIETDRIVPILDKALGSKRLIAEHFGESEVIYLPRLRRAEQEVADHIRRLSAGSPPWPVIDAKIALDWVAKQSQISFTESQRAAVTKLLQHKLGILSGGAGVGKTTLVRALLAILQAKNIDILMAAPTGRAAKRIEESVGLPAKTLHRLLEWDPRTRRFLRNASNPLETKLVIVDETSMVDTLLMRDLLAAIADDTAVLFVGDPNQLPSIGPGAVLGDLIDSGKVPVARLTEIHRQSGASRIIQCAHQVNAGIVPIHEEYTEGDCVITVVDDPEEAQAAVLDLACHTLPVQFGYDALRAVQVLTPMNVRGRLGAQALNRELQARLNPNRQHCIKRFGTDFAVNDRVIQLSNAYDKTVFNGDLGTIAAVDVAANQITVDFDGREVVYPSADLKELALGYAISIHKSQGSEYPAIIVPILNESYVLLERALLYTAITRGRERVHLVVQKKALETAVRTARAGDRVTRLADRLA